MSGYIYCFSNESMEGIYKIGFTTRTPLMRLKEANRGDTWSLSGKFHIEFAKEVDDCREKERKIHKHLSLVGERVSDNREFFKISLEVVRSVFDLMDGRWYDISGDEKFTEIVQGVIKDDDNVNNKCEIESPDIENVVIKHNDMNLTHSDVNITSDDIITCGTCSKIYKSLKTYKQHLSCNRCNKNPTPRKIDGKCQYCTKEFVTKQNKQRHEEKCPEGKNVNFRITLEKIKHIVNNEVKSRDR